MDKVKNISKKKKKIIECYIGSFHNIPHVKINRRKITTYIYWNFRYFTISL